MACPLCGAKTHHFYNNKEREFKFCISCSSISLDSKYLLSPEEEKRRYDLHKNISTDVEYQKFVRPIVNAIQKEFTEKSYGLDYGSGKDSAILKLLTDHGYSIKPYDPFYLNDKILLKKNYDFIACCEVIEHFHNPYFNFKQLYKVLNPGGKLYCMTKLYSENMNFDSWYYKNDPTHVFFYSRKTIEWIATHFEFKNVKIKDRLIVFEKN